MKFKMPKFSVNKKDIFFGCVLLLCVLVSVIFVENNDNYYKQTIVKITDVTITDQKESQDYFNNKETITNQKLTVIIQNGTDKGKALELENEYSSSGAYDNKYMVGDKLFVTLEQTTDQTITGSITGMKRDQYLVLIVWLFILSILIVGRIKGLFSVISLTLNIIIFSLALDLYLRGINLLLVCSFIVIAFTVFSLFLVSGNNHKTYAAIISTIIGTFSSLFIAFLVMKLTNEKGIRYEEMQFLTHPPYEIFMAEILVGSLGAIMDIAITMSSSIYELVEKNKKITAKALIASGMEIGKDIMGTMINVLFFAYVSGSIPMILLQLKNGLAVNYTFYMNLSLELVRALTGSIGIVLTIPIALYTSVYLLHKRRLAL